MTFFTSEYDCKIDTKGRMALPSRVKAQLPAVDSASQEIVIRKGFEQCLVIYTLGEFKRIFSRISGLSEFNAEARKLQRTFLSGATTVELDSNGRFLIPKQFLAYAALEKNARLVGTGSKLEVWNPALYDQNIILDPGELSNLAERHLNE